MFDKLTDIVEGRGQEGDVEFLMELGHHINDTSHCGLGKSAANPVLSTIRYFRDEYDAHIRDKHCPALVCPNLIDFVVMEDKCKMCGLCYRNCPSEAITGKRRRWPGSTWTNALNAVPASRIAGSAQSDNYWFRAAMASQP